jgi:hypothetical protein
MSWRQKIRNNLKLKLLACASSLFIFGVSETLDKQNQKKNLFKIRLWASIGSQAFQSSNLGSNL